MQWTTIILLASNGIHRRYVFDFGRQLQFRHSLSTRLRAPRLRKVYVFDWSKYPTGSYRPRFNGNSLACCTAPYDSSTQIPSLGEGDYASIVFDNELSDIPQGNITYRWFKCAGLGSGAGLVAKELGSSPSLSLSGLQGSYINCEVTLTVNGKSKTFVPKAICNGKVSDGIYVRPRIG